jgi:hypothetical protein
MKKHRIVEVHWTDAVVGSGETWAELSELKNKAMPSISVGFLVKESKDSITLAALKNEHHVALTLTIPRRMIDSMRDL